MTTILLVDDDPFILKALEHGLRRTRPTWSCAFASDGASALDALARSRFDVVVSDMRMPGMDGAELLTRVRERYPLTVRVVMSGQAEGAQVDRATAVAHGLIDKPAPVKTLIACVEHLLERMAAVRGSAGEPASGR